MTTEPLTAAELARHLRLDSEDPGYADLSAVITAARQSAERFLNATIANRTRTLRLDAFPAADGVLYLPRGPVTAISSIAYVDAAGANQTVASYLLVSDADGLADRLGPAYGESWPVARDQPATVTITYAAGMMAGSPLTLADEDIRSAIKLIAGDLWEHREGQIAGVMLAINPTVDRLLNPYRRRMGI